MVFGDSFGLIWSFGPWVLEAAEQTGDCIFLPRLGFDFMIQ